LEKLQSDPQAVLTKREREGVRTFGNDTIQELLDPSVLAQAMRKGFSAFQPAENADRELEGQQRLLSEKSKKAAEAATKLGLKGTEAGTSLDELAKAVDDLTSSLDADLVKKITPSLDAIERLQKQLADMKRAMDARSAQATARDLQDKLGK
jgi:small-conductance mechanosensitive channel